ncbi:MAG TPA: pirin family protein [Terriglobales bacterium]|nr:pirin family protein [Terriglobales bacterium]
MITVRKSQDRGHANHGWLDSRFTFSFAEYYDPKFVHFRSLRVINEDWVQPGSGFGTHPHRDIEIITYVLEGALAHKDSLGNGSSIVPGEVQRMSAGTGVLHSEYNHSTSKPVHLLQIWIMPNQKSVEPSYEQKTFPAEEKLGKLRLIASPEGKAGSVAIHQDARVYATLLKDGASATHTLQSGRGAWIQVARGSVEVNGTTLQPGDGAAIADEQELEIVGKTQGQPAEVLLFDLA